MLKNLFSVLFVSVQHFLFWKSLYLFIILGLCLLFFFIKLHFLKKYIIIIDLRERFLVNWYLFYLHFCEFLFYGKNVSHKSKFTEKSVKNKVPFVNIQFFQFKYMWTNDSLKLTSTSILKGCWSSLKVFWMWTYLVGSPNIHKSLIHRLHGFFLGFIFYSGHYLGR